jgi:hypothetical protein
MNEGCNNSMLAWTSVSHTIKDCVLKDET